MEALRRDVRLLGDLLGRVLVEQEGERLLELEEQVRALARAGRDGDAAAAAELAEAVRGLQLGQQALVLRAFALFFQLANIAEQHHRLRRRRQYEHEGRLPPESLAETFLRLEAAGVTVPKGITLSFPHEPYDGEHAEFPAVLAETGLPLPVIAKPTCEGSSKGIRNRCLIRSAEEFGPTVLGLWHDYKQPVLVEEFISGDEVTAGIVGNDPPPLSPGTCVDVWPCPFGPPAPLELVL